MLAQNLHKNSVNLYNKPFNEIGSISNIERVTFVYIELKQEGALYVLTEMYVFVYKQQYFMFFTKTGGVLKLLLHQYVS